MDTTATALCRPLGSAGDLGSVVRAMIGSLDRIEDRRAGTGFCLAAAGGAGAL